MNMNEKYLRWVELTRRLEADKAEERALRDELAEHFFPDAKLEGTHNIEMAEGWKLKLVTGLTRTLDGTDKVREVMGKLPAEVAEKVFVMKYSLGTKAYKGLGMDDRLIVDQIVTAKPKAPTLKLIPPKEDPID